MKKLKYKELFVSQIVLTIYGVAKILRIFDKKNIEIECPDNICYSITLKSGIYFIDNKIDPKHLGIPNINFSIVDESVNRNSNKKIKFAEQRLKRGFDDSETWCLAVTYAQWLLPRVKRYYKLANKKIVFNSTYKKDVKTIIKYLEFLISNRYWEVWSKEDAKLYEYGTNNLGRILSKMSW